jgi:hypothetical protein
VVVASEKGLCVPCGPSVSTAGIKTVLIIRWKFYENITDIAQHPPNLPNQCANSISVLTMHIENCSRQLSSNPNIRKLLTLSNPIFLKTHTPQLLFVLGGKEVGGLLVIILQF